MVNYLREIVSGKKARFIDHETNLDLVYVTDRILMYVTWSWGARTDGQNGLACYWNRKRV